MKIFQDPYRKYKFVILAKTRWHLRAAIRSLIEVIESLGLCLHQEKRFVGRIDKGFDFLDYQIHSSRRLRPSAESLRRLVVRAGRLYEQGDDSRRLWQYVTRWTPRWLWGALDGLVTRRGGVKRYMVYVLKSCHGVTDQRHPITAGVRFHRSMTGIPNTP